MLRKLKKTTKKTVIIVFASVVLCVTFAVGGMMLYSKFQMGKIPALTFREALEYTTRDNSDAVITVGIIKDGQMSYTVYGENGVVLPAELHTYEIGSLTKTFTAALIYKAVGDGMINVDDTIDEYLILPADNDYPTITELLTHTSGYRGYYFESPMIANYLKGRNDYYDITKEMVLKKAGSLNMNKENYDFSYSNFGYAVLGFVLEKVYDTDYTTLLNEFVQDELNLRATHISDYSGDLGNYWEWKSDDAYISAGAVTSNIDDMMRYAKMQLEEDTYFAGCHQSPKTINASTEDYKMMDINLDEIGMAWITDNENGIVWHSGGTGDYNSYLGFHRQSGVAVVILSNLSPNYRIPATVLGVKLLLELSG